MIKFEKKTELSKRLEKDTGNKTASVKQVKTEAPSPSNSQPHENSKD